MSHSASGQPYSPKWWRWASLIHNAYTGWIVLSLSLVVTLVAYTITKNQVEKRAQEKFEYRSSEISNAIEERLSLYVQALYGGVGLFNASENVNRSEWKAYVESIDIKGRLPGIQGMGYAIPVEPESKHTHEQAIRSEGFPEYTIKPAGERELYTSIVFLEPFDWRNQRAFGYDMWSNELRREAMQRARASGKPATSALITLVQETDKDVQKGFLTYLPVYSQTASREFLGWVYAAFRASDLMHGVLGKKDIHLSFSIYDGGVENPESLLYDSRINSQSEQEMFSVSQDLTLQGRLWKIVYKTPQNKLISSHEGNIPNLILAAGITIDLLLFYVIISMHFINRHLKIKSQQLREEHLASQKSLSQQIQLVEEAEKEADAFFELAPDALLVVDEQGNIVKANESAHKMFSLSGSALVGKKVEQMMPEAARAKHVFQRHQYHLNPSPRKMAAEGALKALREGGREFPVAINLVPMIYKGKYHTVASVHDLSQQKYIEQTLANAKNKAEHASQAKTEFVANMSHEIRTPLNAVLGSAQLLNKTSMSDHQKNLTKMIQSSGEALLGVINDILDFSKIEAGQMELAPVNFDLNEILSRLAIMMSMNSSEKDLELVIDIAPDVPTKLYGDPLRLQQVLINLTSNAIKFTHKGSVTLYISVLRQFSDSVELQFRVKDSGIGMTQDQQKSLFKAFSQADTSITRRFGGTGLGLIISNKIVNMMGGNIEVSSVLNGGSTFSFSATLAEDKSAEAPSTPREGKVAIIEPRTNSAGAAIHIFERLKWEVEHFDSVDNFAHKHASDFSPFNLILVDAQEYQKHSVQFKNHFKDPEASRRCPIIVCNSKNQNLSLDTEKNTSYFHAAVTKPLLKSKILNTLSRLEDDGEVDSVNQSSDDSSAIAAFSEVKALLVEDNPLNQTIASNMLEDLGLSLTIANNGQEAINIIKTHSQDFDLILMDIQMPVMDGLTATQKLRTEYGIQIPIIALTAGVLSSEKNQCIDAGMTDFVAKPIDEGDLFRAIRQAVSASGTDDEDPPQEHEHHATVFDSERLQAITKGRVKRLKGIRDSIEEICNTTPEKLTEAKQAAHAKDIDKAKFVLHSLKGLVGNFGGLQAFELIQSLEIDLQQKELTDIDQRFDQLESSFKHYQTLAMNWCEEQLLQAEKAQAEEKDKARDGDSLPQPVSASQKPVNRGRSGSL